MKIVGSGALKITGFTFVELLIVVAVMAIAATIILPRVDLVSSRARTIKLESDVSLLNRAVEIYHANGGRLDDCQNEEAVIAKLKTTRAATEANVFVGLNGSQIDPRLATRRVDRSTHDGPRVVWNAGSHLFEIVEEGDGIGEFYLDNALAEVDYGTESREQSILNYNPDPGWVWSYRDRSTSPNPGTTPVVVLPSPPSPSPSPTETPELLSPPGMIPSGGIFPATAFPLSVELTNPNPSGTEILYSINGSGYQSYAGAFPVNPGSRVQAYVRGDPKKWIASVRTVGSFSAEPPDYLVAPDIQMSATRFTNTVTSIQISIANPNPAGSSTIRYAIVDTGGSLPDLSAWSTYSSPINVTSGQYPDGFQIQAFADAIDYRIYYDSPPSGNVADAEFFGIPTSGNVLFLIDSSGSMNQGWSGGDSRMTAVMDALYATIQRLGPTQSFNVITFSGGVSFTDNTWQLIEATQANKQTMIERLKNEVSTGGGTNYQAAFEAANLFSPIPTRVIFLTDGEPTSENYSTEILTLADKKVRIDSVGIALTTGGQQRLAEIATATGGSWVNLEDY